MEQRENETCKWIPLLRPLEIWFKASTLHSQRKLLMMTTTSFVVETSSALTVSYMHSRYHENTTLWGDNLKKTDKHYCKRTALTSPILASLYVKAGLKEQTAFWSLLRSSMEWEWTVASSATTETVTVRLPRLNEKLKCVRFHVVSSHDTGAMSLWYKTKTRYERSARVEEARRARLSAACFGRRLRTELAAIEPTAHWRHTASRRQRRQRRAQPAAARGALCRRRTAPPARPERNLPQPIRWQPPHIL